MVQEIFALAWHAIIRMITGTRITNSADHGFLRLQYPQYYFYFEYPDGLYLMTEIYLETFK